MAREGFERQLQELQDEVILMSSMVEKAIDRSINALKERDLTLARQVIDGDAKIDQQRFDIEENCITLIATQQPMASDLRTIVSVLSIITDLERIGDYAEGIAEIMLMIGDEPYFKPLVDIPRMAKIGSEMLGDSLKAFVEGNAQKAREIAERDDEIDELWDQVFRECISYMLEDPRTITIGTRLIWVAHKLERIADRMTNICERVVFTVTGKMENLGG
ncbi:MAG: phosphate signaling complex protein PhoU [Chloroflexota bacterium]|nr:phosphate signaling complex protein PhoU [Chloroflexota bacterium]